MNDTDKIIDEFFDELKPNTFDPFIVIKEYVEWYPENAPAIQQRGGTPSIKFAVDLLAEVKRLRELVDNLYDFTKQMQDKKRKDPIGLQVLKDRMYWRNEE